MILWSNRPVADAVIRIMTTIVKMNLCFMEKGLFLDIERLKPGLKYHHISNTACLSKA
jgi:hypothetical protein